MKKQERSQLRQQKKWGEGGGKKDKAVAKGKGRKDEEEDSDSEGSVDEVAELIARIQETAPAEGTQPSGDSVSFDSMPLSACTKSGLKAANLVNATEIQAAAIPHALAGRDILGAAKTGSGKTLAFVIPLIEKLFRERWSFEDGLAAIIITPTRELALQIFDVIRVVGSKHQLSAGIVTGGKKGYETEQEKVVGINILVATPGRLLQHLEQTPGFDASQLQVLVLDEADRILDLGFRQQLDQILAYLPPRQTMLFSATQTKSVKDLARLSLNRPQYLSVHEHHAEATPSQLVQNYVVCKLQDKLDALFSFIKTHLKSKVIVFFSTCAQVRFVHECFCGMQPGVSLTALHGKLKQERRTMIYMDFTKKKHAVMFATDLAARGLDFPDVDWVIQMDAPEDAAMYIHRVGRTARYTATGRALLMLLPTEEPVIVPMLSNAGIPIKKLTMNPKYAVSVSKHAAALLVAQPECKALAKKAFVGYLRSLQLMPQRELALSVNNLPVDEFATSLGLAFTPLIPTVQLPAAGTKKSKSGVTADGEVDIEAIREGVREKKNVNYKLDKLKQQIKAAKEEKKRLRASKVGGAENGASAAAGAGAGADDNDDLFEVKATYINNDGSDEGGPETQDSGILDVKKSKQGKLKIRGDGDLSVRVMRDAGAKKITFDEDGSIKPQLTLVNRKHVMEEDEAGDEDGRFDTSKSKGMSKKQMEAAALFASRTKSKIDAGRAQDYTREQQRVREMHREKKAKLRGQQDEDDEDGGDVGAVLATAGSDSDNDDYGRGDYGESEGDESDDNASSMSEEEIPSRQQQKRKGSSQAQRNNRKRGKIGNSGSDDVALHERLALEMLA